ncbi:hypothetical protein [Xanthomonas vasicola]|uniref:hypothetical protein n=1 Tax=Xanthomonas vasicola TaxID=56459 RepID=UPI0002F022FB|nr:hypothetical protein [Xanthomonas vasicola]
MEKEKLEKFINNITPPPGKENAVSLSLRMLRDDIFNQYYLKYDELPVTYRHAWNTVVLHRMANMKVQAGLAVTVQKMKLAWAEFAKDGLINIGKIHFGQIRVAGNFAGSGNVNQKAILGFPQEITGRPLKVYANDIRATDLGGTGVGADRIPVQIFLRGETWIATNNRGYAVHCMAGVMPLRIWPHEETVDERNRLRECWDAKGIRYLEGVQERLSVVPRTLPSTEMPLTNGPNDTVIAKVVTVPEHFTILNTAG